MHKYPSRSGRVPPSVSLETQGTPREASCEKKHLSVTVVPTVENIDIDAWLDTYVHAIASAQKSTSLAA